VCENKMGGEVFGPKKTEVSDLGYYTRKFVIHTGHIILLE